MGIAESEREMQEGWDDVKYEDRPYRSAGVLIDPKEERQLAALQEPEPLKHFEHCRTCRSSFIGEGHTVNEAKRDALASLANHESLVHPTKAIDRQVFAVENAKPARLCVKCNHDEVEHTLAVCRRPGCWCGVRK